MTDLELMKKVSEGDPSAGRQFVDNHQVNIYNVCYSFLQNEHDAEDLAQEVFIEAIRNAVKFRGDAKLSTWLYRIAVNRSLNHLRDNRKRRFWRDIDSLIGFNINSEGEESGESGPFVDEDYLEQEEQKLIIGKAIQSLPENQRIAFTLNKLEDLSYTEVAGVMQTSLSSVESLIHRARVGLQSRLKKYYLK
jgi:RNA polymerase sigma-70 factor (ECF subfamily)